MGRDLLRVRTTLVSSLMARDPTLNTTLEALTTLTSLAAADTATPLSSSLVTSERLLRKLLKSLVTRDLLELVRFSHVLLRQLLLLVAVGSAEDLRDQSVRTVFELLERLADHEAVFHRFVRDHFFFGPDFHLTMLATLNRVLDFWPIDEQGEHFYNRVLTPRTHPQPQAKRTLWGLSLEKLKEGNIFRLKLTKPRPHRLSPILLSSLGLGPIILNSLG